MGAFESLPLQCRCVLVQAIHGVQLASKLVDIPLSKGSDQSQCEPTSVIHDQISLLCPRDMFAQGSHPSLVERQSNIVLHEARFAQGITMKRHFYEFAGPCLSLFVLLVPVISTSTFDICSFLLFDRLVRFPFKFPCLTLVYSRKYRVRTVVVVALNPRLTQRPRDPLHTEHSQVSSA